MSYLKLQPERAAAVTPSDTANIPPITGGDNNVGCVLYVGGPGTLTVTTYGGDTVTFSGVLAGTFIPINVVKVWAAGTSATNIIALW
jgi:hypothetical protein